METEIIFVDRKLKNEYDSLERNKEFKWLYSALTRAFTDIIGNPSVGVPLKKYRIPRDLKSKKIDTFGNMICQVGGGFFILLAGKRLQLSL